MSGVRRSVDVRRLGAAASYPGIDPRVWAAWATVLEIGLDAAEGLFADVQLQPDGDIITAYVGMPYAGDGFGTHYPVMVDDVVLVVIPGGDADNGAVIVARAWNAADKPPSDLSGGEEGTHDVVTRVRPGQRWLLKTSNGANVEIDAEGGGSVHMLGAGSSFTRGEDLESALNTFAQNIVTAATALVPAGPPITPVTAAEAALFVTAVTTAATQLAAAASSWKSQRIKGE